MLGTQNVSEQNQKHFLCPGHKICVRNKRCARGKTGKHLCWQQCVLVCQGLNIDQSGSGKRCPARENMQWVPCQTRENARKQRTQLTLVLKKKDDFPDWLYNLVRDNNANQKQRQMTTSFIAPYFFFKSTYDNQLVIGNYKKLVKTYFSNVSIFLMRLSDSASPWSSSA